MTEIVDRVYTFGDKVLVAVVVAGNTLMLPHQWRTTLTPSRIVLAEGVVHYCDKVGDGSSFIEVRYDRSSMGINSSGAGYSVAHYFSAETLRQTEQILSRMAAHYGLNQQQQDVLAKFSYPYTVVPETYMRLMRDMAVLTGCTNPPDVLSVTEAKGIADLCGFGYAAFGSALATGRWSSSEAEAYRSGSRTSETEEDEDEDDDFYEPEPDEANE